MFAWWWGIAVLVAGTAFAQPYLGRRSTVIVWQTTGVQTDPISEDVYGMWSQNADSDSSAQIWAYRGSIVMQDTVVLMPESQVFLPWRLISGDTVGSRLVERTAGKLQIMKLHTRD